MKQKHNYLYSIFLLLVIVVMSSGISFSRYVTTLSNTGDQSTIVTVNKYNLDVDWGSDSYDLQYPGLGGPSTNQQTHYFTLKNTKATKLSYNIAIAMSWNEDTSVIGLNVPLKMKLYIVNEDNTFTQVGSSQSSNLYILPASIDGYKDIKFCLKWNWGTTPADRDYRFAGKKIDVVIDVNAEQYVD